MNYILVIAYGYVIQYVKTSETLDSLIQEVHQIVRNNGGYDPETNDFVIFQINPLTHDSDQIVWSYESDVNDQQTENEVL